MIDKQQLRYWYNMLYQNVKSNRKPLTLILISYQHWELGNVPPMFFGQPCCCYNFASAGALVQYQQGNISIIVNVTNSDEPIVGYSVITIMLREVRIKTTRKCWLYSLPIENVPFFIFDIREESDKRVTSTRISVSNTSLQHLFYLPSSAIIHTHRVYTLSDDRRLWKSTISGSSSGLIGRMSIAVEWEKVDIMRIQGQFSQMNIHDTFYSHLPLFDTNLCSYWLGYGRIAGRMTASVFVWSMILASRAMRVSPEARRGLISTSDM